MVQNSGQAVDPLQGTEKYQRPMNFQLLKDRSLYQELFYP